MKPDISFTGQTAVIVCHDSLAGPPHHTLRDFVSSHGARRVVFVGHQNRYVSDNPVLASYLEVYEHGKKVLARKAAIMHLPEWMAYIRDTFLTYWWVFRYAGGRIDYFVGLGNLNAIVGVVLKLLGGVRVSIYYVIDYMPQRFTNPLMNTIYHAIDYLCARYSTVTWNYAEGMIKARNTKWKYAFPNQIVVPNGIFLRKETRLPFSRVKKNELVYLGTLYEQQGIELVIEALVQIKKKIPSIHLTIIGIGPLRERLEKRIAALKLTKHIRFQGFIEDPKEVDRMLAPAALGMAMYKLNTGFVAYTEPGKVKRYLSCSVPVVMTDVSPLSTQIVEKKCGFCCSYDATDLANIVISFLKNQKAMMAYRTAARAFVRAYEWDHVFTRAFLQT